MTVMLPATNTGIVLESTARDGSALAKNALDPSALDPSTLDPSALDPGALDKSALEDAITELAAHISAATWRLLKLIREYDSRKGWNCGGTKSCAHWLNWKCGINLGAAREKVRVAHALARLPLISAAFREGRLSYSKVRAMTRVATPQNEDYLLMIATHGTASHLERVVSAYRRVGRLEAARLEATRHAQREVSVLVDEDGSYVVRARLPPEQGARFVQALEHAANCLFQEQGDQEQGDQEQGSQEQRGQEQPAAVSAESPHPQLSATSPAKARRADALDRMVDTYLARPELSSTGGDRCTLHLHCDADSLRADGKGSGAALENSGDVHCPVSAETSRRLACDCGVVHWQEDAAGNALNIGRRTRTIPPALRRALKRRDGGCAFPGCTAHRHVDGHHIRHWADGGETRLDNLVLLCRHHHRLVHEGGFGVRLSADGQAEFRSPQGALLDRGPDKRFCGNANSLYTAASLTGLAINPRTLPPLWRGERMDLGMAVDAILRRDRPPPAA